MRKNHFVLSVHLQEDKNLLNELLVLKNVQIELSEPDNLKKNL